ncbi:MAG: DEAD/DEAH box helicase, partial [Rhodomicrobium sp.]
MIEELSARIWSYVAFHADIAALREHMLHRKYIASEPRPFSEEALIRLLKSATILAASKRLEFREAAYKIATAAAEIETPELTGARQLLLLVLSRIGNFPALAFAKRRFGVSEDALPIRALAETYERNSRNTVILSGQKVALTDFQFELWSQLEHNLTLGVSAPTSAGKSFVLQAYAKKLFSQRAAKNMVFVVPTRALINQVSDDVAGWLSAQDMDGELVTTPIPKSAELPVRGVYVVTQERLQLLQSAHPQLGFDLMLVDEAQSIGEGPRGVLLSSVIDEAITRNDQMQLLFAGPNLTDPGSFARVFGRDQKTVKTEEASVVQNIIFVDVDEIQTSKARLSLFAEGNKIEIGLLDFDQPMIDHKSKLVNVALGLGKDGQSLIYALGAWESEEIAFGLADTDEASSDDLKELSNFIKDAVHEKYLLAQSVLKRVGYHYGRMPALVRKAIEDAFSDGLLRYLVTTSTLLYGVNLPAQNLFLHNPERGKGQPISSNDFWNLAGRAGRLGKEFSGNIFLIDYGTWPSDPMAGPKEKEVIPSIEEHIVRRTDELIAYMNNPNIIPDREKPDELENTFVKLVRDHLEGRLSATLEKVGISSTSQKAAEIETAVSQSVT